MEGFVLLHTPLGPLWAQVQHGQVVRLSWGQPPALHATPHPAQPWLAAYFNGASTPANPAWFAPQGTPFRQRVWQALLAIPHGQTRTYGQLATQLNSSPRAVGGAVGSNPIPILIPCHRVMGGNGALTGFSAPGGIASKQTLLNLEARRG